jgi:hypothetical protein
LQTDDRQVRRDGETDTGENRNPDPKASLGHGAGH